jgi:putative RNA polymerase ECF-type sigma factor
MEKIEQLFRQHYSKMFLVSRMILGDEETARDVVSDIFADMLSGKLRIPPNITEGYFVVLTRNRCLNSL